MYQSPSFFLWKIAFLLNTLMTPLNEYYNLGLKELTETDITLRCFNKLILFYLLWKGLSIFHVAMIILFCFKIPPFDGTFLVTLRTTFKSNDHLGINFKKFANLHKKIDTYKINVGH